MRGALVAVLLVLLPAAAPADGTPWRTVYLNRPGALERLKAENPRHYAKILSLLDGSRLDGDPLRLTEAKAGELSASGLLLTTWPPQRDFAITLDGTIYRGRTTLALRYEVMTVER